MAGSRWEKAYWKLVEQLGIARDIGPKRPSKRVKYAKDMLRFLWGDAERGLEALERGEQPPAERLAKVKHTIALQRKVNSILRSRGEKPVSVDGVLGEGTREAVKRAQQILKEVGLYNGPIDGLWGPATERAYRQYRGRSTSEWGKVERTLTKEFRARLRKKLGSYNPKGESFCAEGVGYIMEKFYGKSFPFPSTWEFFAFPPTYTFPWKFYREVYGKPYQPSSTELAALEGGTILLLYYPHSSYLDDARQALAKKGVRDARPPTHMMIKVKGRFYHVIGDTVYSLSPREAAALLRRKGMGIRAAYHPVREAEVEVELPPIDSQSVELFTSREDLEKAIKAMPNEVKTALYFIIHGEQSPRIGFRAFLKASLQRFSSLPFIPIHSYGAYQARPKYIVKALDDPHYSHFWKTLFSPISFYVRRYEEYVERLREGKATPYEKAFWNRLKETVLKVILTSNNAQLQTYVVGTYVEHLKDKLEALDRFLLSSTRGRYREVSPIDRAYSLALYYHYGNYNAYLRNYYTALLYKDAVEAGLVDGSLMKGLVLKPSAKGWKRLREELKRIGWLKGDSLLDVAKAYAEHTGELPRAYVEERRLRELEAAGIKVAPYGRRAYTTLLSQERRLVLR